MEKDVITLEIERLRDLLGLYFFIHERMWRKSKHCRITYEDARLVLMQHHNIPKEECNVVLSGLEILGLIEKENSHRYKIKEPEGSHYEIIFEYKKKLNII